MKDTNASRWRDNNKIVETLEVEGKKQVETPPLGPKYLSNAPFKFGGKKRSNSNSGGQGRAGRRQKRFGKAKH